MASACTAALAASMATDLAWRTRTVWMAAAIAIITTGHTRAHCTDSDKPRSSCLVTRVSRTGRTRNRCARERPVHSEFVRDVPTQARADVTQVTENGFTWADASTRTQ